MEMVNLIMFIYLEIEPWITIFVEEQKNNLQNRQSFNDISTIISRSNYAYVKICNIFVLLSLIKVLVIIEVFI